MQFKQTSGLLLHQWRHSRGNATAMHRQTLQLTGLYRPVATASRIAAQLTADRGLPAAQRISNMCDVVSGFNNAVNLISFNLVEVFIVQLATLPRKSRSLEC